MRTQQPTVQRSESAARRPGTAPAAQTAADAPGSAAEGIRLTRRGRLVLLGLPAAALLVAAVVGLILLLGGLTNQAQASAEGQPGVSAEEVTVAPGDTLWSVAASAESDAEIQEIIDRIAELNGLTSSELEPGQTLYVPVD